VDVDVAVLCHSSFIVAAGAAPVAALQDFHQRACWAHHPQPHQEYMDYRKKQVR
jgi:exosome complex RNA-binding protein Rrp42 (RNase PH superfamily)